MDAVQTYDRTKGLGPLDRMLLAGASSHMSPNELSDLTNGQLKPAAAAARVLDILDSRQWLSQAHKKMLLLDDLMELKDTLKQQAIEFRDLDAAKPLISVLTLIEKTISADKIDLTKAMKEITRAQGQMMLSGIKLALERTYVELERRHPEIVSQTEINEVFIVAMPEAVREIESRVNIE